MTMSRTVLLALSALTTIAAAAGAQGNVVTVTASDYAFVAPDSVASGITTFRFMNHGAELHHVQIVRLDSGKTMADLQAAMQQPDPPPAWVRFVGGVAAIAPHGHGGSTITARLKPGQHVLLCFVPGPDGKPHIAKGMVRPFMVTPASNAASNVAQAGMPKADATLTLYDYNFDFDQPLKAGRRVILVRNTAGQFHEATLVKLPPNTAVTALTDWMAGGMKGPPPAMPHGGVQALTPGEENLLTVDLEPGDYALYCFVPAPDGKDHVVHGMMKKFTVIQ
jgi:hypothetical protein